MADQTSYSRCPYCQRKLEKRPQRKSKCPHCAEVIYVRGGDLMRADELAASPKPKKPAAASKPSAKKPGAAAKPAKTSTKRTVKQKTTSKSKPKPKNQLDADLRDKNKKNFKPDDLQAGVMLVIQLLGKLLKPEQIAAIFAALTGGATASRFSADDFDPATLIDAAAGVYADLDANEQRQLLAVLTWMSGGFTPDENQKESNK